MAVGLICTCRQHQPVDVAASLTLRHASMIAAIERLASSSVVGHEITEMRMTHL